MQSDMFFPFTLEYRANFLAATRVAPRRRERQAVRLFPLQYRLRSSTRTDFSGTEGGLGGCAGDTRRLFISLEASPMLKRPVLALAAILVLAIPAARADTLDQVKKRGYLACGSNPGRAGFGLPDGQGHWAGLDIDFCRALAAAIFDDYLNRSCQREKGYACSRFRCRL